MKIVSGGQTGADRAALDVALELGIETGGWCPRGRKAEDGAIPGRYPMTETPTEEYEQRTEWNARDSDGTLILTRGEPAGGTAYTIRMAERHRKPHLVVDFEKQPDPKTVRDWIRRENIKTLNVAGARISKDPRIYEDAAAFLNEIFKS